jgi:cellulose synthase (UDP-forming)
VSESSSTTGVPFPADERAGLSLTRTLLSVAFAVVGVWYLSWRPSVFNPEAPLLSWVVYGAELFGFVGLVLHAVVCGRLRQRTAQPPPATATAAVFIKTVSESIDIVRRTAMAAQRMQRAGEVWLLDEGDRLEMLVLAQELGCRYLAPLGRAGSGTESLNLALQKTSADFIAVFAAHDVPARNFLQETLGFFSDERVAVVQTAQDFYNLDSYLHRRDRRGALVWNEQMLAARVIQPGRDSLDAALFSGSCAVLRRAALLASGGFAAGTVAEDMRTTLRLHKGGWKSVYYARSLAFGLAPTSADAYLSQRLRWGQGAMQAWRQEGILATRGLSPGQRLAYLSSVLAYLSGWQRLIVFLAPAVVLAAGRMPVTALDREFMVHLVPYLALACYVSRELARGHGRMLLTAQYDLMRFAVFIVATGSVISRRFVPQAEPRPMAQAGALTGLLWPQYAVLALSLVAVPMGLLQYKSERGLPAAGLVTALAAALLIVGVAFLAIRHARTAAGDRRREYRFPLPIPLRVRLPAGPSAVTLAIDISPRGCRICGTLGMAASVGDELEGELLLPTGPLPVIACVRAVASFGGGGSAESTLDCEFRWGLADERNQLEAFLFGSDLQWQLTGLSERVPTPLESLWSMFGTESARRPRGLAGNTWSPVLYKRVNLQAESGVGFISGIDPGNGARTLVSLDALPDNVHVHAEEVTAAGPRGVVGRVEAAEVLQTHAAPLYFYKLTA